MNVTTREQFDRVLELLRTEEIKVVDTETNGLYPYKANYIISISIYFPRVNEVYNLAFYHGQGEVELSWTKNNPPGTKFEAMTWQGKLKKQMYLSYWYKRFKSFIPNQDEYFQNLPVNWFVELKLAWGKGTYILHNARFDAHMLYASGFPDMEKVYDTLIALHVVNEDWRHLQFNAPYTYKKADGVDPSLYGQWARDENGELLKKVQYGNRSLKWQSAFFGFPDATAGETVLSANIDEFREELIDFIMTRLHDPMNDSLLLSAVRKSKGTIPLELAEKQRAKIAAKVEIDDKANLWMLPSGKVSYYAELDVILTWQLYEKTQSIIKQWGNEALYENLSNIQQFVAFEMERNGFKLDVKAAEKEIKRLDKTIAALENYLKHIALDFGMEEFNPNSPIALLDFLNSGVLGQEYDPEPLRGYMNPELLTGLKLYPNIRISKYELEESGDELYGTNKTELERVEDHLIVRVVKEIRKARKASTTYLKKWIDARDRDEIVRFSVNIDGTVAGRASSSGDAGNGQNIPDRGGYTVKKAVVAYSKQWRLVAADYGQLELRLAAWIAEGLLGMDEQMTMTNLFLSGKDMHSYVRDMINVREILFGDMKADEIAVKIGYNIKGMDNVDLIDIVSNHTRQVAKTMNFGLLYSGGKRMLAKLLKIDEATADILVKSWRTLFPAFQKTQNYITEQATTWRTHPSGVGRVMAYQQPISARWRKLHLYPTSMTYFENGKMMEFNPREAAARKVWNNTVQGLGGFIALQSAYTIGEQLGREHLKMFVTIHDAHEANVHEDHLHLVPRMGQIMVDWPMIVPNLTVDLQASTDGTWQGMKKIKDMDKWVASRGMEGF